MGTPDQTDRGKAIRVALLIVLLLLLAGSVTWNILASRAASRSPVTRKSTDFLVTWRCLACGYQTEDRGAPGPRVCPACGKNEFYASFRFTCSRHGVFRVAYNYDEEGRPSVVKVEDGPWVPYFDQQTRRSGLHCPKCDEHMMPAESPRLPPEHEEPSTTPE
jgi:hypothetical protein